MKKLKVLSLILSTAFLSATFLTNYEFKDKTFDSPIFIDDALPNEGKGVRWYPSYTPYDTSYSSSQYVSMNHVGNIENVWNKYKGEEITIAVIDSGIDYNHPDFVDDEGNSNLREDGVFFTHITQSGDDIVKINTDGTGTPIYFEHLKNYTIGGNTVTGEELMLHEWAYNKTKKVYEYNSHGTNVAGTVGAALNHYSKTGTVGIAPKVKILPIKCDFYMDSVGYAVNYCTELNKDSDPDNDVHIINMSIEASSGYGSIYNTNAVNAGITLIAAAGNSNTDTNSYPASSPNVIGIGALANNSSTTRASFSNYNSSSATASGDHNVDLVAPGYVYAPDYTGSEGAGYSSYTNTQGTSFSSPIVAGAAALYYQKYKGTYSGSTLVSNCYTAMKNACVDIGDSGWDRYFGYGRLDIASFVGTSDITNVTSVSIDQSSVTLDASTPYQLTSTISPSSASSKEVIWYTESSKFSVSHSGVITGKSNGSGLVYCETLDGHKKDSITVTIDSSIIAVESVELVSPESFDNVELEAGESLQIEYSVLPSNATNKNVIFESDDTSIATVSNTGLVEAIDEGTVIISVSSEYDPSLMDMFELTVTKTPEPTSTGKYAKVTSEDDLVAGSKYLIVNENSKSTFGAQGNNYRERVNYTDTSGIIDITNQSGIYSLTLGGSAGAWTIFDGEAYVSYTSTGNNLNTSSTATNNNAKWTISFTNGNVEIANLATPSRQIYYNSGSPRFACYTNAQVSIQLYKEQLPTLNGVTLDKSSLTLDLYNSASATLTATINQDEGVSSSLSFSSSDSTIVSLTYSGNVASLTGKKIGNATITATATYGNVTKTATCNVTVNDSTPVAVTSISLNKTTLNLEVGRSGATLSVSYLPINANQKTTTWTNSDSTVASISSTSGSSVSVNPLKAGETTITATCNGHQASCVVTVSNVSVTGITLSETAVSLPIGGTKTISATITPSDATTKTVTWESNNSSVASVNNGKITANSLGNATITVKATDGSNISATCSVTVTDKNRLASISLNNLPESVPYKSDAPAVTVTANYTLDPSKDVTSSATITNIDTSVLGNQTISASYTEDGITKEATKVVKVTNNGAQDNVGTTKSTSVTNNFTNKSWGDLTNNWISGKDGTGYGNGGVQIAKGASGANATSVANYSNVTNIVVSYCTNANDGAGSVSIKIGSNTARSSTVTKTGGTSARNLEYSISPSESGKITITVTCTSNSIYIKSITIFYGESYPATPTDQAKAWAIYFNTFKEQYCNESGIGSDIAGLASVWSELGNEYTYMIDDSKDAFFELTDATIAKVREDYRYIYATYGSQLGDNFVKNSSGGTLNVSHDSPIGFASENIIPAIALVSVISITSIGIIIFIKKRKENETKGY